MQAYKSIIAQNTTLVLSTDSDLFKFLKGMTPDGAIVPPPRPADSQGQGVHAPGGSASFGPPP
jgi:membrane protease subunit HflC